MPNHVHGIIIIRDNVVGGDAPHRPYRHDNPTRRGPGFDWRDLGQIKSITAKRINALRGTPVGAIHELPQLGGSRIAPTGRIAHLPYCANPANWEADQENPKKTLILSVLSMRLPFSGARLSFRNR